MFKILFVCAGDTCRSPMASSLFNHKIKQYSLSGVKSSSAGLSVEYGSSYADFGKIALKDYGIKRVVGTPTQITAKHLAENNMIICATEDYKEALIVAVADKFRNKIYSFKDFTGINIPDPYGGSIDKYRLCLEDINTGLEKIIGVLLGNGVAKPKKSKSV